MTPSHRIASVVLAGALLSTGLMAAPSNAAPASSARTGSSQSFYVKTGHRVTISLRTAADGGYGWVIVRGRNSPKFDVLSKKVVSKKGQIGGYATTVYVLRTTALGTATFKVVERRSFDKKDVIDAFTLHLHITKSGKKPSSAPVVGQHGVTAA